MEIKPPPHAKEPFGQRYANELDPPTAAPDSPPPKHKKSGESWRSVFGTVLIFLLAPLIAICIAAFCLQSYQVDGQSMETTLQNRDRLIVNKIPRTWARITGHNYIPKRGDIIVFNQAGLFDANGLAEKQLIKRVIGLPGDHIVVKDGSITIYNAQHPSGFNPDKTVGYHITATTTPGNVDITLKSGQIFVCGDNRPNSEDSRYFGPINSNQIVGQLLVRIVPVDKAERF